MKLYVVSPDQTPLADTGRDLVDALRASASEIPELSLAKTMEEADALVLHEMFSFKEQRYIRQLYADPIVRKYGHKLYTINFDDCATGLLKGLYTSLPWERFDPQLHATIPYFRYHNPLVFQANPEKEPTFLGGWRGNEGSHVVRKKMLEVGCGDARFWLESTASWYNHGEDERARFVEMILASQFSLCPSGIAPTSFRIFESMALGRAPVIIADQFVFPAGLNWDAFSIKIREKDVDQLGRLLEARSSEWKTLGNAAKAAWDSHFAREKVARYYLEQIVRLHRARPADTPAAERARWQARPLWISNGWTLKQRLGRKVRWAMRLPLKLKGK